MKRLAMIVLLIMFLCPSANATSISTIDGIYLSSEWAYRWDGASWSDPFESDGNEYLSPEIRFDFSEDPATLYYDIQINYNIILFWNPGQSDLAHQNAVSSFSSTVNTYNYTSGESFIFSNDQWVSSESTISDSYSFKLTSSEIAENEYLFRLYLSQSLSQDGPPVSMELADMFNYESFYISTNLSMFTKFTDIKITAVPEPTVSLLVLTGFLPLLINIIRKSLAFRALSGFR